MTTEACEKNRTMTAEDDVKRIFTEAAEEHGVAADVEIIVTEELKIKWVRQAKTIMLCVSDYVTGIPPENVRDLAETLMERLYGDTERDWSTETSMAFSSDEFAEGWQDAFIERNRYAKGLATKGREFVKEVSKDHDVPKGIAFMYTDRPTMQVSVSARVVALPKSMRNASKEAMWFAFDIGVRRIAGGIKNCKGAFDDPWVFVNLTAEDRDMLLGAGAWKV